MQRLDNPLHGIPFGLSFPGQNATRKGGIHAVETGYFRIVPNIMRCQCRRPFWTD